MQHLLILNVQFNHTPQQLSYIIYIVHTVIAHIVYCTVRNIQNCFSH